VTKPRQRNHGCRITVAEVEGLTAVTLENAQLRVGILAGKGADIYELLYKPRDVDVLWRSPLGIVNPAAGSSSIASAEGNFMDSYEGGWQELFPTLGAPARYYGAELGEHGEVAMLPWEMQIERDEVDGVEVTFEVRCRRSPFLLRRTLSLTGTDSVLSIRETAVNEGGHELHVMWGHHPVLGPPFLEPGCVISLAGGRVHPMAEVEGRFRPSGTITDWPIYRPSAGVDENLSVLPFPDPRHVSELFVDNLPAGWCAVTNSRLGVGVMLRWDTDVCPYLWLWRTLGPAEGHPWYGQSYTLGIEPFSSVPPDFDSARQAGTTLVLKPGAEVVFTMDARIYLGDACPP
jgi:hypothetical protein